MLKKIGILALSLMVGLAALNGTPAKAAPVEIKISSSGPESLPMTAALFDMAKYINDKSNGKYHATVYPFMKLGNPSTIMQGLQTGMIHFMHDSTNNVTQYFPVFGAFDVPYIFSNYDQVHHVFYTDFFKKIQEMGSSKNHMLLAIADSSFRNMNVSKPATTLADVRKYKIRTTTKTHTAYIKAMGISATPMPFSEVYTGMQQGVIDGFDLDYPYTVSTRLYEVAPYIIETNHMYSPQVMYTGTKWFNKLSAEDQEMFKKAVNVWYETSNVALAKNRAESKEVTVKAGCKIHTPTPDELKDWINAAGEAAKMMPAKEKVLYDAVQAELKAANLL